MAMISAVNPGWKFLNIDICGEWPPLYNGRLEEKKDTKSHSCDDDWWVGLTPPPIEE